MKHHHTYRTLAWWTLTLPDVDGSYDGFLSWVCTSCGDQVWSTAVFAPTSHAMAPDEWQRVADKERRAHTAWAQAAAKEEKVHVRATDKYDTFAQRR